MSSYALDDDLAVDLLALRIKRRLAEMRDKGKSGWDSEECSNEYLSKLLQANVDSGDPIDVAAYCAFISARSETIMPKAQEASRLDRIEATFKTWETSTRELNKTINKLNLHLARMENVDGSAVSVLSM